ncbi:MAG: hypothetical protein ACREKI_05755 [Gemmatimonadota bacterium]
MRATPTPPPLTRLALCLVAAWTAAACSGSGAEAELRVVPADEEFVLAPGETVVVARTGLHVTFEGVAEDGRCPIEWFCIWAGNAIVRVRVAPASFPTRRVVELNTGLDPRAACVGRHELVLVSLEPQPSVTNPVPPDGYRATFRVSAALCVTAQEDTG